jgi:hypothetical protein
MKIVAFITDHADAKRLSRHLQVAERGPGMAGGCRAPPAAHAEQPLTPR